MNVKAVAVGREDRDTLVPIRLVEKHFSDA